MKKNVLLMMVLVLASPLLAAELVLSYDFEGDTTDVVTDKSGNGINGVLREFNVSGQTRYQGTGVNGTNCLVTNANMGATTNKGRAVINLPAGFTFGNEATFVLRLKRYPALYGTTPGAESVSVPLGWYTDAANLSRGLYVRNSVHSTGAPVDSIMLYEYSEWLRYPDIMLPPDGEWHLVIVRLSSSFGIYVRVDDSVYTNKTNTRSISGCAILMLGNRFTVDNPFSGEIDDVRVYKGAMTDAEIEAIYQRDGKAGVRFPETNAIMVDPKLTHVTWTFPEPEYLYCNTESDMKVDVFFGQDPTMAVATQLVNHQHITSAEVDLQADTTYYWRVDIYDPHCGAMEVKTVGNIWSFTTASEPWLDFGFDEGGGSYAYDASNFTADGVLYGSAALLPTGGLVGGCLELNPLLPATGDGSGHVRINMGAAHGTGSSFGPSLGSSWTCAAWVMNYGFDNTDGSSNTHNVMTVLSYAGGNEPWGTAMLIDSNWTGTGDWAPWAIQCIDDGNTPMMPKSDLAVAADGKWHFCAISWDGASNQIRFMVDDKTYTVTQTAGSGPVASGPWWNLGFRSSTVPNTGEWGYYPFCGRMDKLRFWGQQAHSFAELAAIRDADLKKAAHAPFPADGDFGVSESLVYLSWILPTPALQGCDTPSDLKVDVFFGEDPSMATAAKIVSYQNTTTATVLLEDEKTYYWRVDVYDSECGGTEVKTTGQVWSFTTLGLSYTVKFNGHDYIDSICVKSRFHGYQSAIDRDLTGGHSAYDYSVHIIKTFDQLTPIYRLFSGGRWYIPGSNPAVDGDHILQHYSTTGEGGTWQMWQNEPDVWRGLEDGYSNVWFSGNVLEPEVVLGPDGIWYMFTQVEIREGEPLDIPNMYAAGQADRIQLLTSTDCLTWTRFADRGVIINVDQPTVTNLHHQEVIYVPWDADGKHWWMYIAASIRGLGEQGIFLLRSDSPYTFDWTTKQKTWFSQFGNQIGYIEHPLGRLFVRITFGNDNTSRAVPALQFSTNGLDWYNTMQSVGQILMDGSKDNNYNNNCYFLGISTMNGTGLIENTGINTYKAIYGASTSKTPVAPEIFKSEVGVGNLTLEIIPKKYILKGVVIDEYPGVVNTADGLPCSYNAATVVTLHAYPDGGYRVKRWVNTDDDTSTATVNTVRILSNTTVSVEFERIPFYFNDFLDLQLLISSWLSVPSDTNWNGDCDISIPADNVINIKDFSVFSDNWNNVN